jgi:hypothetical protein
MALRGIYFITGWFIGTLLAVESFIASKAVIIAVLTRAA